jgi:ketosteroid isomerase-like protein
VARSDPQIVLDTLEVFNRSGAAAALDTADPAIVMHAAPEWPGEKLHEGREACVALLEDFTEPFDEYRWDVDQVRDLGDRVLTLVHHSGRAGGSWIKQEFAALWRIENGLLVELWFFFTWDDALAAAGVEPRRNAVN